MDAFAPGSDGAPQRGADAEAMHSDDQGESGGATRLSERAVTNTMSRAGAGAQLPLDLPKRRPYMGRDAYIVTPGNGADITTLDAWLGSDEPFLVICGAPSAGKTHLASIAAEALGALLIDLREDGGTALAALARDGQNNSAAPLVIDGADGFDRPDVLIEVLQRWRRNSGRLALVGRGAPEEWAGGVVDLATRLGAAPRLCVSTPDEALIRKVMEKLFVDRQLTVGEKVVEYASRRLPRRLAAVAAFVDAIDAAAIEAQTAITLRLAGKTIAALEGED